MGGLTVRAAEMPRDLADVQRLCWDYRDHLLSCGAEMRRLVEAFYPEDLYSALMEELPVKHARPHGLILLAVLDGAAVGCGMYHPLNKQDAEIKRVFISKAARGTGAGQKLSQALIDAARSDGYHRILLDTNKGFDAARGLYEKLGFQSRGPYSDLPPDTAEHLAFYELTLRSAQADRATPATFVLC